ncbi:YlxQ family RNA-binding protein [Alkalicoccus daliensis]|uniref:Ribosomal protein L7Ae n=1 Tax=Alkalicoccus daliensis TaxID=745820 RepID=A0A1H0A6I2_9BACI|nr:YlxQ family RNA-binding protein [Alkalicoccus daliensis]SDN29372.1 Ribosomal protein L7Ae [Alkalicoccus daliensis]
MMDQKQTSLLGLMQRARAVTTGEEQVVKAIQSKKAKAVILSSDASANTHKKINDKCSFYKVPLYITGTRYELGHAIGKEARVVIAILDEGFSKAFKKNEQKRADV